MVQKRPALQTGHSETDCFVKCTLTNAPLGLGRKAICRDVDRPVRSKMKFTNWDASRSSSACDKSSPRLAMAQGSIVIVCLGQSRRPEIGMRRMKKVLDIHGITPAGKGGSYPHTLCLLVCAKVQLPVHALEIIAPGGQP